MATYSEHISKAKENLQFLSEVDAIPNRWDWKVTICFYTVVHLVNAHTAKVGNLHYRSHSEVEHALNHENKLSLCKLDQKTFLAYQKLKNLSRRSRYMCSDNLSDKSETQFLTHERHFAKALRHMNTVIEYVKVIHNEAFAPVQITCSELNSGELAFVAKK